MVIFLTSLRHPDNAIDYERVEGLLRLTISSVLGQRDADIAFVVVCNQRPSQVVEDSRVHFHIVDFPAPGIGRSHRLSAQSRSRDKGTKLVAGLAYAAMFNPDYVYICDSDDWLHCDIAAMMLSSSKDVWYSNVGYFVDLPRLEYKTKYGMTRYCGSTFGYKYEFLLSTISANKALTPNASQDEILDAIDEETIEELLGNHSQQVRRFRRSKTRMNQFPFPSVCWVVGTGENRSGTQGGGNGMPIGKRFLSWFSISTDYANARQATLFNQLYDWSGQLKSRYTWAKSLSTGKNFF